MTARTEILLVDDDRDEVDVALRALGRSGLDAPIEVARDGVEALEVLGIEAGRSDPSDPPRVVFLDLKMPRIDGFEVLRRIRNHPPTANVPVVVLSASDRTEDIKKSYALGANSFLVKQFDRRAPGADIADAARYWIEMNRTPLWEGR